MMLKRSEVRPCKRGLLSLVLAASMVLATTPIYAAAGEGESGIGVLGTIPVSTTARSSYMRMLVHTETNVGFSLGKVLENNREVDRLFVYDLEKIKLAQSLKLPGPPFNDLSTELAVVDERNDRLLFPPGPRDYNAAGCESGPKTTMGLASFSIATSIWKTLLVPCTGSDQFKVQGLSFDPSTNKIYAVGARQGDYAARSNGPGLSNKLGQSVLLRQMDGATMALDWEIDLQSAGCDSILNGSFGAMVARHADLVLSYCYGAPGTKGVQGYAVKVPLSGGKPIYLHRDEAGSPIRGTEQMAEVVTTPTLPGQLYPIVDPGSGRMLLLTQGDTNGTAVWVFDPPNERFYGVIASGAPVVTDEYAATYVGLNILTGRAYLLSAVGLLLADARTDPLPAGLSYPFQTLRSQGNGPYIAVAPSLNRLFIPLKDKGFIAVGDSIARSIAEPKVDPDRGTAAIAEEPGKTGANFASGVSGYGIHFINTGGVSRAINQYDPFCFSPLSLVAVDRNKRCVSEQVLASGNREFFLASSLAETGSQTGTTAEASAVAFPSKDTATDADLRKVGSCGLDLARDRLGRLPPDETLAKACAGSTLATFRSGTGGSDGKGFPVKASQCEDFTSDGSDKTDTQATGTGGPAAYLGTSNASCNQSKSAARSSSTSWAFSADMVLSPTQTGGLQISVARSWSESLVYLAPNGIVSQANAVAEGIVIGPYTIQRIESTLITRAKGVPGSAVGDHGSHIYGVDGPGIDCKVCDFPTVVAAINENLGQRVRASIPEAFSFKSPKGYQALVTKNPHQRESDQAMNDDDTFEVPGLELLVFNDSDYGRSRFVVHFAGLRGESRYGVFLLPDVGDGFFSFDEFLGLDDVTSGDLADVPTLGAVSGTGGKGLLGRLLGGANDILEGLRLIVMNPKEFGLLFMMWTLLASPVYLWMRRRLMTTA